MTVLQLTVSDLHVSFIKPSMIIVFIGLMSKYYAC